MTFIDKKIEVLKEQLEMYNQLECKITGNKALSNWFKQTLTDYGNQRFNEGQKKAYDEFILEYSTYDSHITSSDVFNFTKQKQRELEA